MKAKEPKATALKYYEAAIEKFQQMFDEYKKINELTKVQAEIDIPYQFKAKEAQEALVRVMKEHFDTRGKLVSTQKELTTHLKTEIAAVGEIADRWMKLYRQHGNQKSILEGVTNELQEQIVVVEKLGQTLEKHYQARLEWMEKVTDE